MAISTILPNNFFSAQTFLHVRNGWLKRFVFKLHIVSAFKKCDSQNIFMCFVVFNGSLNIKKKIYTTHSQMFSTSTMRDDSNNYKIPLNNINILLLFSKISVEVFREKNSLIYVQPLLQCNKYTAQAHTHLSTPRSSNSLDHSFHALDRFSIFSLLPWILMETKALTILAFLVGYNLTTMQQIIG